MLGPIQVVQDECAFRAHKRGKEKEARDDEEEREGESGGRGEERE